MKTVYKYPLRLINKQTIKMPEGAVILTVDIQDNQMQLWALVDVDPDKYDIDYTFYIVETGQDAQHIQYPNGYIGTVFFNRQDLVFHVFQRPRTV